MSKSAILENYINADKNKDRIKIKDIINNHAGTDLDINTKIDKDGNTLLSLAVKNNDFELVCFLLDHKADPNIVADNYQKLTPLHHAAINGNLEMIKILLEAGANPNAKAGSNYTALHYAARECHTEIFYTLIKAGADPNPKNEEYCPSVLASAIKFDCNLEIAAALIALGADVNHPDEQQMSPLYLAATFGPLSLVRLLILKGADVNFDDNHFSKNTALDAAAQYNTPQVVQELIESGATFNEEVYNRLLKLARIENRQFLKEYYRRRK